jgi:hypothetical protein
VNLPPVLSVRQPWPFAIFHGGKDVENRPRRSHHRGPLLIHASASITREEAEDFRDFIQHQGIRGPWCAGRNAMDLPTGVILGVVDMVDCVEASDSRWWMGPYGYVLANPRPFATPIPAKGALGFWRVPERLLATVERALTV